MPISQSDFNALAVGAEVIICQNYPSRYVRRGIVGAITKTTKRVDCNGISYSFMTPTRRRGDKWGSAFIATKAEAVELEKEIIKQIDASRLNDALKRIGELRTGNATGDAILMALADATAKAEFFYK
jgi:hypothetical protein